MIPTIVVDDELHNLNELCNLINKTGFMSVKGRYQNPLIALDEIESISPMVAFVDIDLPEMDGISFADRVLDYNPNISIVFVTAHNQYAVQAFEINALDYILKPIRIKRFDIMVERIKDRLEAKATSVSSKLTVNMFGKLEVKIGEEPILWKRSTAEEVFAYLMVNYGSFVHKEEIIENIWPEYEFEAALSILKTSVCRIRSVVSGLKNDTKVIYSGGRYCLQLDPQNTESDYLQLCKALSNYRESDKSTYEVVEKACDIFGNGFLIQQGYIWSIGKDEELRKRLISIMGDIAQQYNDQGNVSKYLKVLKRTAELAPYYEQTNFAFMKKLEQLGEYQQIALHYKWLEKVLKDEYDTEPSRHITDSFKKYIR